MGRASALWQSNKAPLICTATLSRFCTAKGNLSRRLSPSTYSDAILLIQGLMRRSSCTKKHESTVVPRGSTRGQARDTMIRTSCTGIPIGYCIRQEGYCAITAAVTRESGGAQVRGYGAEAQGPTGGHAEYYWYMDPSRGPSLVLTREQSTSPSPI